MGTHWLLFLFAFLNLLLIISLIKEQFCACCLSLHPLFMLPERWNRWGCSIHLRALSLTHPYSAETELWFAWHFRNVFGLLVKLNRQINWNIHPPPVFWLIDRVIKILFCFNILLGSHKEVQVSRYMTRYYHKVEVAITMAKGSLVEWKPVAC